MLTNAVAEVRNKVDGSQTSCPSRESDSELSATGRRADLYSALAFREIQEIYNLMNKEDVSLLQLVEQAS